MPLDTGAVASDPARSWGPEQDVDVRAPTLDDGQTIGAALQAVREFYRLTLEDVAEATRIRRHYLQSIETMQLDQLPSRPFTIGYIRAYAAALGLDPEQAVARFKTDAPDDHQPLRAPVGVRREGDPRLIVIAICGAVVVGGILAWNFAQRAMAVNTPPRTVAAAAPAPVKAAVAAAPPQGPLALGAPLPAPQESTTPKPYVTPGLEAQMSGGDPASGAIADTQAAAAGVDPADPVGSPFVAKGTVFGDASLPATVILQARKPGSLTVHRADGTIYFARFMAAGQAFRAPLVKGWTVEVSDPAAFDLFVGGTLKGVMPSAQAQIAGLVG